MLKYTRKIYILEDGEIARITKNKVTVYDRNLEEITKEEIHVTWDISSAEKNGCDFIYT